jgi:hypothetical protein
LRRTSIPWRGEITATLKAEVAEEFRQKIRKHTRDAMRRKALQGYATGNRIFGYDNVRQSEGHTVLRINQREAEVIRQIYSRSAAGDGARTIAAALNRGGVPKPRAQRGRKDGWSVSTIRAVLTRPLYRGEVVYGRTQKAYNRELKKVYRDTTREKGQIRRPEDTWIRVTDPAVEQRLRIVDPDLAERVDARLQDRRERYLASVKRTDGLRPHKAHGKYLLSGGMLICPSCGGHFEARKYPWKPSPETAKRLPKHARVGHPGQVYICSTRRRKPGVCTNTLALPIDETDDTVLDIIEGEVLGTRFIRELLGLVDRGEVDDTVHLTAERDRLRSEVDNLVKSIAAGVPPDTVAPAITERESQIAALEARLRRPRQVPPDLVRLKAALEQRAEDWKRDLRAEPQVARMVVRRL